MSPMFLKAQRYQATFLTLKLSGVMSNSGVLLHLLDWDTFSTFMANLTRLITFHLHFNASKWFAIAIFWSDDTFNMCRKCVAIQQTFITLRAVTLLQNHWICRHLLF